MLPGPQVDGNTLHVRLRIPEGHARNPEQWLGLWLEDRIAPVLNLKIVAGLWRHKPCATEYSGSVPSGVGLSDD